MRGILPRDAKLPRLGRTHSTKPNFSPDFTRDFVQVLTMVGVDALRSQHRTLFPA